jgi:hypothetical protein
MKTRVTLGATVFIAAAQLNAPAAEIPTPGPGTSASQKAIPWNQIGATAGAQHSGEGLKVTPTEQGARLHCAFQRLDGLATREGLCLTSTASEQVNERFCVKSIAVGRNGRASSPLLAEGPGVGANQTCEERPTMLPATGDVSVEGQIARFTRPGLVEEYAVSTDGVQQDFLVLEKPGESRVTASQLGARLGEAALPGLDAALRLELAVTGARVEQTAYGAQLVLEQSGRKITYSRLKVTDATGKELPAWMEVADKSEIKNRKSEIVLVVVVDDAEAVYPVRIDPTFSDANWISLGGFPGANGFVHASVVDGVGNLYVGGSFTEVGDVAANNIAKWNGTAWSALGSGLYGSVWTLAVSGSNIYAGGNFQWTGGSPANYIAKWDGSGWSALGSGVNDAVQALAVSGSDVYAGGYFTTAGGSAANYIAKWNGSTWTELGSGLDSNVWTLAVSGRDLYAGGQFTTAGGSGANYIAKWDGSAWSALGLGVNDAVQALAVSGSNIYAGGDFQWADGRSANHVAKWDGSAWSALGSGMNNSVYALAVSGGNVFAGGSFGTAGGIAANSVAKWDGSAWSALSSGMDNPVNALAVSGSNIYVGGNFQWAGGRPANYVAKWDGSTWSALGSGVNSPVVALAVSGSDVYAGGNFTPNASYIARWDGRTWSALGSGLGRWDGSADSAVYALAVSGSNLYAGGWFTTAGGSPATNIAKWDGTAWSAMGPGLGGYMFAPSPPAVYALAVSGSDVYAGGWFPVPDDSQPSFHVAKWNGSTWSALGSGVGGNGYAPSVAALAVSGSDLYAGGYFTTAGGSAANYIAKWNGSTWSALGSGVGGWSGSVYPAVYALAVSGSDLYAGGSFTVAGGKVSTYLAKAIIGPPPFYFVTTNTSIGLSNGQFHFTVAGPAGSNAVIFTSTNLQTWTPLVTNPLTGGSLNFTDTLATNFTRRFYRGLLQP